MKKNTEAFHSISSEINDAVAKYSLKRSSKYLADHYGKKVLILLDEYDTPMQEDGLAFDGKEVLVDGGHRYIKNLLTNRTPYG